MSIAAISPSNSESRPQWWSIYYSYVPGCFSAYGFQALSPAALCSSCLVCLYRSCYCGNTWNMSYISNYGFRTADFLNPLWYCLRGAQATTTMQEDAVAQCVARELNQYKAHTDHVTSTHALQYTSIHHIILYALQVTTYTHTLLSFSYEPKMGNYTWHWNYVIVLRALKLSDP